MSGMKARRIALFVVLVAAVAAATYGMQGGPTERELTAAERHERDEEQEIERMLIAPPDAGGRFRAAPYPSQNTDGKANSGARAVAYRSGGRVDESPAAVTLAPEARLWRTGFGSWEPSMGITSAGKIFFSARNTNQDPGIAVSADSGRTWLRIKPPEHAASLDPFVHVDAATDTIFASDIDPAVNCTPFSRSDDDGKTWRVSRACGVFDHQNHFSGPPPPGGDPPTDFPSVVYYCAISGGALAGSSTFTGCLKSLDGGLAFTPTGDPPYPPRPEPENPNAFCDGAAAHGIVDVNGTVHLPRGWCGEATLASSTDEGATWTRTIVTDKPTVDHEVSVAADPTGNLYYLLVSTDHRPYLVISRDGGKTWSEELDIMPPGVGSVSAFSIPLDAGDTGRIAFAFMGTADAKPDDESLWTAYMGTSVDALAADPLFHVAPVTNAAQDTFWKGLCEDVRCGNLGDFLDVEIGPDGSARAALVDSCPGADNTCITDLTLVSPRGEAVMGQLAGGAPLIGTLPEQQPTVSLPPRTPARACRSRRNFFVRVRQPRRGRVVETRVFVNGRRVKLVRGRALGKRVRVRKLPAGRVRVRVITITSAGRRTASKRRYRICARRKAAQR